MKQNQDNAEQSGGAQSAESGPQSEAGNDKAPPSERTALQRSELYPQYQHEIVRELPGEADEFDLIRERMLEGYGYNTARAYWGDLEHWRDWCYQQEPATDGLHAGQRAVTDYLDELDAASYSPNT
jgi:hypothetical protein